MGTSSSERDRMRWRWQTDQLRFVVGRPEENTMFSGTPLDALTSEHVLQARHENMHLMFLVEIAVYEPPRNDNTTSL